MEIAAIAVLLLSVSALIIVKRRNAEKDNSNKEE